MMTRGKAFTILGSALILAGSVSLARAESYEQKDSGTSNAYKAIYTGAGTSAAPYDAPVARRVSPAPDARGAAVKSDDGALPSGYVPGREREY